MGKIISIARILKAMMLRAIRHSLTAFVCLAAIAAGSSALAQDTSQPDGPKWIAEMLDSSKLPRMPGTYESYASKPSTILLTKEKVAPVTEATRALLVADGWQEYLNPFSSNAQHEKLAIMNFKKGWQAINVFISVAPAQGGATSIHYTPIATENDLPFPKDATNIEFAPDRPVLLCMTAETIENTLTFFGKELAGLGYTEWSIKAGAKKAATDKAGEATPSGGYAYFVHEEKKPLQLVLRKTPDGKTKVDLKAVPQDLLDAQTRQAKSASEMADVMALPRPDRAYVKDEDARKASSTSLTYWLNDTIPIAKQNIIKMLGEDGWVPYVAPFGAPLEKSLSFDVRSLAFKKGGQGISLFFMTDGDNFSRTGVSISSERLSTDIPLPPDATDIVFDHRRPLLDAIAPGTVNEVLAFFRKELVAAGWKPWSAADTARYPNAKLEETIDDGVRAYFVREKSDRQPPIQVSIGSRKDGRVDLEVRVPPFARPQDLAAGQDTYGLPKPDHFVTAGGRDGQVRRELTAQIAAERDVVLAFYRREMGKLGWKEDARGAVAKDEDIVLNFAKPDTTAVLTLGFEYDLTTVKLVQQLPDRIAQERAKAQRDAEEKLRKRTEEWMRGPPVVLEAMKEPTGMPIPLPDTAEKENFDKTRGDVKFTSASRVTEIAAFYRTALKPLGFNEVPGAINGETMTELNFMRGGKRLFVTIMKMGEKTDVRGYGPGLAAFAADARGQEALRASTLPAQPVAEELEADDSEGLPVPKKSEFSIGHNSPFRHERDATVLASLQSTLAFYRRELAKLGWKEEAGAIVKPEQVSLTFTAADGPGALTLSRKDGRTVVKVTQRHPAQAEKDGVIAKDGMGRIMIGSAIEAEAVVTINRQVIKVAPGMGEKGGPRLDLKPGKYSASIKVPGKPAYSENVTVVAGRTMGLLIGPGGVLPLEVY